MERKILQITMDENQSLKKSYTKKYFYIKKESVLHKIFGSTRLLNTDSDARAAKRNTFCRKIRTFCLS
jgi:hypothetical protein